MRKNATAIVTMNFVASTIKRLVTREGGSRFRSLFEGVSRELIPTHVSFFEGRRGSRAVCLGDIEALEFWSSSSGASFSLEWRRQLKGTMTISGHYGNTSVLANWIAISLELIPIVHLGLQDDALRLFENLIEYTRAEHGRAAMSYRSSSRYVLVDAPEVARPPAPAWNGVVLGITDGGPHDLKCLASFGSWINVLGRGYVDLLGKEKLLALDVYKRHEDSCGRLWLQMAERPEQMHLPEVREKVSRLVASLNAPDVFCRRPRTERERSDGVDAGEYRTPDFDWSELREDDPYSARWTGAGIVVDKSQLRISIGFGRQVLGQRDLREVIVAILTLVMDSTNPREPFAVALAEDGELVHVCVQEARQWTDQEQADIVAERLGRLREKRALRATGACFYGKGRIPGQLKEGLAFKIHLEQSTGETYVVYLPFDERGRKREYGILVVESGEPVVFVE